jgi:hypothetical protein
MRRTVTPELLEQARALHAEGVSFDGLSILLGFSSATWSRHLSAPMPPGVPTCWGAAAARAGLPREEYLRRRQAGLRLDRHRGWV